jgi:ABC-2 type transport system permease protein
MTNVSWSRIAAVLRMEYYIARRSLEVLMDMYLFSLCSVVMFGFITRYLEGALTGPRALYPMLGMVLFEVTRMTQYSMSVSSLYVVESHNFGNLFVSPLTLLEYVLAQILAATGKVLVAMAVIGVLSLVAFDLDLRDLGIANLVLFFVNLSVFAWSLGLVLLGLIFCYGVRIQALAWGVVFLFEPLCATFFPVDVLPQPLRAVALAVPATHVFDAARAALSTHVLDTGDALRMSALNGVYFAGAVAVFLWLVRRSQISGQFAKNDQ